MKQKIRILHITQAVGGGVERYIQMLLKYLDHSVYENDLLISSESGKSIYEQMADHVEQIDMRREIGPQDICAVIQTRKAIRRLQPDIIYAHSSKAGAIARIANLGLRKACIYNAHGWAFNMAGSTKKQKLYTIVERMLAPMSDRIICISDTEKASALKHHVCVEDQITVIHNGIDIEQRNKEKDEKINRELLGIPEDAFVIGMVGRISRQKAPDIFVQMAQRVLKKIPQAHFLIVGDGELREQTEQQIIYSGMKDKFRITGWVEDTQNYMKLFDTAVLLSRWEGFGLVLPEYMLAGKPIVATKVDAIPELIQDRVNGLLVEPDNPQAACDAVFELYRDHQLRESLVRHGMQDVYEKYNIKRVALEHMCLFQQLIP